MSAQEHAVLNYRGISMYQEDVDLFGDGCWLNDSCICFALEFLQQESASMTLKSSGRKQHIQPSVVMMARFEGMSQCGCSRALSQVATPVEREVTLQTLRMYQSF
jgi:hypothetical protein